jgi:hypothetical protein
MNCFNIRELQGILKRRFFTDMMSSHEYKTFFGRTVINLRFKLNANDLFEHDTLTFHGFGLKNSDLNKLVYINDELNTQNYNLNRLTLTNIIDYSLLVDKTFTFFTKKINDSIILLYLNIFKNNLFFLFDLSINSSLLIFEKYLRFTLSFDIVLKTLSSCLLYFKFSRIINFFKSFFKKTPNNTRPNVYELQPIGIRKTSTPNFYYDPLYENSKFIEKADDTQRFNRFYNSLLNYDYKTGNYVGY